jgi:hypothetical protein
MPALSPEYNLSALYPNVAAQWHPTKNGDLRPKHFWPHSGKKAWWVCAQEHEWKAIIANRTTTNLWNGNGCPYCARHLASTGYNFLLLYPNTVREWHPTKNVDSKPQNFTPGSNKEVWWLCDQGHVWKSTIHAKTLAKSRKGRTSGCPYCRLIKIPSLDKQTRLF